MIFLKKINIKPNQVLFYLLLISVLYVLIYNILYYSPKLGYDSEAHFAYVNTLSRYLPQKLYLPSAEETREFFNPPIGYLFPSITQVFCRNLIESNNFLADCEPIYSKATQIFQSFLYLITIAINLFTLKLFNNSKSIVNLEYLILLSILGVNYRTISMIRGEPYILFFMSIFLYLIYKFELSTFETNSNIIVLVGITIACLALSRQWSFFLFIPLILLVIFSKKKYRILQLKFWTISGLIGALFSSWFYINLYLQNGSFLAFNKSRPQFSFKNQQYDFYLPSYEHLQILFTKPIRPNLDNQFITILYSDLWGDYWGYFSFTSKYLNFGRDQSLIGDYLARVNIVSIFTFTIIIVFCALTYRNFKYSYLIKYINLSILVSFFGYLLFTISYPEVSGDTIKASYIIQLFHLVVFSASIYFHNLKNKNKKFYNFILLFLFLAYIHNFQSFLSHFPFGFYPA